MSAYVTLAIAAVLLLIFLLLASRDLFYLFYSPVKGMGPGIYRIWAVARTTMLEVWNQRVWLVVPIQVIISVILILAIRPFDETERIPLYLRVLLTSQEILVLLVFWVMACISLPRERFFKIVVTNVSKPLSRLEILLGKMTGFICAAFLLLMVMGATGYITLLVADSSIRASAREEYALAQDDFHNKNAKLEEAAPPPESLKRLAEEGSLFAYNYISAPKEGFAIVGNVQTTPTGLNRFIKGGSSEQAIYSFKPHKDQPGLPGEEYGDIAPPGQRPYFQFYFPVIPLDPNAIPKQIVLNVTAVRAKQRLRPQTKTILLDIRKGLPIALWEPEDPTDLFSFPGERDNGEIEVTVTCQTEGVYLQILDGVPYEKIATASATDFNIIAFPGRGSPNVKPPEPDPVIRGFERHDKQQIAGPSKRELQRYGATAPLECAIFRFPAASISNVPLENGEFKISMLLDVDKESNQDAETLGWLEVYNSESPLDRFDLQNINIIEKRETIVSVPKKFLGNEDPAKRGELVVILRCQTSGHWLAMLDDSVRIEKPPEPFVLNLIKSELILLCEATLLIVICVAWSVLLGWPVAMLTSSVCFVFGFLRDTINTMREAGGLGALGFPNFGVQSSSYKFLDHILSGLWAFLGFIASLVPDFTKFDSLFYITQLRNMPADVLFTDIAWALAYTLPFIALGYIFFRKQELG